MVHNKLLNIIILLYVFTITSCAPLNYAEEFSVDEPILLGDQDSTYGSEEEILTDILDSSRAGQIFDKFYNCEDIYVRLRIALHIFYYKTINEDGEIQLHIYSPVTMDEIIEDIEYAEAIYEEMGLKFKITSVSAIMSEIVADSDDEFSYELARRTIFNTYRDNYMFLQQAREHTDAISVFYALSIGDGISGLSTFPWMNNPYGIQIARASARKYVFAHEIGHYFGLYHTFQDPTDYVEDTPYKELTMEKVGTPEDPNQFNVMSYPDMGINDLFLTNDQIARVKTYLTTSRDSHVILEEDEDFVLLGLVSTDEERADFLIKSREMLIEQLVLFKRNETKVGEIPVEKEDITDLEFSPILDQKCKNSCQH